MKGAFRNFREDWASEFLCDQVKSFFELYVLSQYTEVLSTEYLYGILYSYVRTTVLLEYTKSVIILNGITY